LDTEVRRERGEREGRKREERGKREGRGREEGMRMQNEPLHMKPKAS
jgi:hypothetical protein